jgi:hypothetical protein
VVGDVTSAAFEPRAVQPAPAAPAAVLAPATAKAEPALSSVPREIERPGARGVGPRIAGGLVLGVGVGVAVSGLVVYLAAGADRNTLSENLINGALPPTTSPQYKPTLEAAERQKTTQPLAVGLVAAGGAVAAGGLLLMLLLPPREGAPEIALMPTPGGAALTLSGDL